MSRAEALLDGRPDTPITSYRLLPPRLKAPILVGLVALAAVAWWLTAGMWGSMSKMVNGLGQVGQRMPNEMGIPALLKMWAVMMVAMMAPAVAPMAVAHNLVRRRRDDGAASTVAFVVGFLVVWSLVGVVYLIPFLWFRGWAADVGESWWLPALAGALLVLSGGYQFARRKGNCQQACCAPVTLVLQHDTGRGAARALRTGIMHGIHCLGCCWALMVVLLVVGLMNIVWMIGLSLLFIVEKHWHRGLVWGRLVGVALILLGVVVMTQPSLLHVISAAQGS